MSRTIIPLVLLLILTLLNFEYGQLNDFNFSRSGYLEILMILICIVGIFFELKRKSTN